MWNDFFQKDSKRMVHIRKCNFEWENRLKQNSKSNKEQTTEKKKKKEIRRIIHYALHKGKLRLTKT